MLLTLATLGMSVYGVYAAGSAMADLVGILDGRHLEIWADLGQLGLGSLLVLASAFVRVLIPGGLALAISALLGLQALSLHNETHLYGAVLLGVQVARGFFAAGLVALAYVGARRPGHF